MHNLCYHFYNYIIYRELMAWLSKAKSENTIKYSDETSVTKNVDFFQWVNKTKWPGDQIITKELINKYNLEKDCLLSLTQEACDSLNTDYNKWSYDKVALKRRSLSKQIYNVWKNWGTLKYINKADIKEILEAVLSDVIKGFDPWVIARDLKQMERLFDKGAFSKLADKLVAFLANKFPMLKPAIIAVNFSDKLVLRWINKKKIKEKNEKQNNRPKIRVLLNNSPKLLTKWHYWWDRTWWGHFPWWHNKNVYYEYLDNSKKKANVFMKKDWQKILINENASLFPIWWWSQDLKRMRTAVAKKSAAISMWQLIQNITYKGIKVRVVLQSKWKKDKRKIYNIKTLFPNYN